MTASSIRFLVLGLFVTSLAGCAACPSFEDYAYPAYGGKWRRADRFHGRVGSILEPAGYGQPGEDIEAGEPVDEMSEDVLPEMAPTPYDEGQDPPPSVPDPDASPSTEEPPPPTDPDPNPPPPSVTDGTLDTDLSFPEEISAP